jgi:hypothetical protein
MATTVEDILAAVRSLPPQDQQEVLRRLAASLGGANASANLAINDFWAARTIDELASEQRVDPVSDIHALALSDWPSDESADEFIASVYAHRLAEREV